MLSDGIVTRQVTRVDAWEVGGLESAGFPVAVTEDAGAVRACHQVPEVVLW